jgi:hypothetical protein
VKIQALFIKGRLKKQRSSGGEGEKFSRREEKKEEKKKEGRKEGRKE